MTKRKDVTSLDDLLGGKAGATGTGPAKSAAPAAGKQPRQATREKGLIISFRLPPDLADEFEAILDQERVSMADLSRFAMARFISEYKAGKVKLPKEQRYTIKA